MKVVSIIILCCLVLLPNAGNAQKNTETDTADKISLLEAFRQIEKQMAIIDRSMAKSANYMAFITDSLVNEIKNNSGNNKQAYKLALIADSTTKVFLVFLDSLHNEVVTIVATNGNDDIATHNRVMMEGGKGNELKIRINHTRETLLSLLNESEKSKVKSDLVAKDPNENQTWESELFQHSPAAAVVTLLKKFKNDAHNTNVQILSLLLKRE